MSPPSLSRPGATAVAAALLLAAAVVPAAARGANAAVAPAAVTGVSEARVDERTLDLTVATSSLAEPAGVRLLLPQGWDEREEGQTWPVLWLLHGAWGTYTDWTELGAADELTALEDVLVVLPEGGAAGFYADWSNGGAGGQPAWETFHMAELPALLAAEYGAGEEQAIAGLSMGGHGALAYAGRHPERFSAAASFSGLVHTLREPSDGEVGGAATLLDVVERNGLPSEELFGDPVAERATWQAHNPYDLAPALAGMPVYLSAGTVAGLENEVRLEAIDLADRLADAGGDVELVVDDGANHGWPHWQRNLCASLPTLLGAVGVGIDADDPCAGEANPPTDPPGDATDAFRVHPYLQNPTPDGMLVTWFASEPGEGVLRVTGGDLDEAIVRTSAGELQAHLAYTEANRAQEVPGLEPGSWLREGENYRHQVLLEGLTPDTTYQYSVTQGEDTVTAELTTAPTAQDWDHIRFTAMSDSETEPLGRVQRREWAPGTVPEGGEPRPSVEGSAWADAFGTATLSDEQVLRYALTEDEGFAENLRIIAERDPDLMLFTGDLVQGGAYQPGWDEFFRNVAGPAGQLGSERPLLAAIGNWENYGGADGAYGTPEDRSPVVIGRRKIKTYFTPGSNGTPEHQGNYSRRDYGPLTFLTLDSSNGVPEDDPDNYPEDDRLTGTEYTGPGTDTQNNYTIEEYEAAGGTDQSPYNEGTVQWNWAREQLADARAAGQIILVQFHHAPFSSGEHGLPMNHEDSSGQGGTPMRIYHDMFEEYGVATVISGHSEMFERSYVDGDDDGVGIHYYDVGVSGDGLRGSRMVGGLYDGEPLGYNTFSAWTADRDAPEVWQDGRIVDGGKHYGHLEVNVERLTGGDAAARITLTPVYSFPLMDSDLAVTGTERRVYDDEVVLLVGSDGRVIDETEEPTPDPTDGPTPDPTVDPTVDPTPAPTAAPTGDPGGTPSAPAPGAAPTLPSTGADTGLLGAAALLVLTGAAGLALLTRRHRQTG
ncbi:alpha/beta hydrolase-fold protein [Georgenia faecalis]|uniref:alpha/beta hydrolase-fold protein n=1 Tax=Georgenia faecalis TaxID=2483799 RepID=UPI000FD876C9|nr:alpha/beta hydrolase-fold protein [Georgenia faecalis]